MGAGHLTIRNGVLGGSWKAGTKGSSGRRLCYQGNVIFSCRSAYHTQTLLYNRLTRPRFQYRPPPKPPSSQWSTAEGLLASPGSLRKTKCHITERKTLSSIIAKQNLFNSTQTFRQTQIWYSESQSLQYTNTPQCFHNSVLASLSSIYLVPPLCNRSSPRTFYYSKNDAIRILTHAEKYADARTYIAGHRFRKPSAHLP